MIRVRSPDARSWMENTSLSLPLMEKAKRVGLGMTRQPKQTQGQHSEAETVRRRDEAIKRALRTPPTHLKDIPKKRKPKTGAPPSKPDGA